MWAERDSNPRKTSVPGVAERPENDAKDTTQGDLKQRQVSAPAATCTDPVEAALAKALSEAAAAGRFDVVALLAKELEARRLACSNVVTLDAARTKRS